MVPAGAIAMWPGTLASIPAGWALCDGANGTPDLRDRFIKGWTSGVNPGGTGGSSSYTPQGSIDSHTTGGSLVGGQTRLAGPTTHMFTGTPATIQPPYYKLAFIMKLAVSVPGTPSAEGGDFSTMLSRGDA